MEPYDNPPCEREWTPEERDAFRASQWKRDAAQVIDTLSDDACNCEEFQTCQHCKDRNMAQAVLGNNAFRWVADLLAENERLRARAAELEGK